MGRVLTNRISLEYSIEASLGVLAGSPKWKLLEPNSINTFGTEISTVARAPITKNRQARKGTVVDLTSAVEFDHDLDIEVFNDFMEGFCFATYTSVLALSSESNALTASSASTPPGYNYTAIVGSTVPAGRLVFARGFTLAINNGLKLVAASSTTAIVAVAGLTTESPTAAQHATVEVCGVQGAAGDIQVDANGDLTSTALDFTTLGLTVGQMIHVGGASAALKFATAADFGFCRVKTIAATKLSLEKRPNTFTVDNGATKTIQILFGRFLRNVAVDNAVFIERSFQFELAYPNLQVPGPGDAYEYALGNLCNAVSFNLPLADKATVNYGFVGTDTGNPTNTRATNAGTPTNPVQTTAFNTSADIARLRIQLVDETGITTCFKSLTLKLTNDVTPEKCLGTLGASFMNEGNFGVEIEAQLLFTDPAVPTAIRNNTTVTMDFVLRNGDGGIGIDIPSMTLGGGKKEYPVNQSVLINTTGKAFQDATLGTSIGVSIFPYLP